MPAAFVGLMMLTIDLNDQLQCHATEIDGVRRDWVFATKLLISTTTIPQHLPHVLRKLVRSGSLITSKSDCVIVTLQSSVHFAPVIRPCHLLAPSTPALLPRRSKRAPLALIDGGEGSQSSVGWPRNGDHRSALHRTPKAVRVSHSSRRLDKPNAVFGAAKCRRLRRPKQVSATKLRAPGTDPGA